MKNACKVVASAVMRHLRGGAPADRRPAAAVPARPTDTSRYCRVDMAEIGRQDRQAGAWVIAVAIAIEDGADGEAVPKIVEPGPACRRARRDAGMTSSLLERRLHVRVEQPRAAVETNKAGACGAGEDDRRGADSRRGPRSVLGCNGNSRDLPNLPLRIVSRPLIASKSSRSRPIASPTRMPVAASKPINVR